jgi:hypothetical protein
MNKLKGTWGKEWNEPKNVKDVLEFKRKVLNKKGDIFKKIDEIDPAEKPEVTIKKEMYFAINNALEKLPGGENFAKYNKQARDLMQIRDIATHMKRTPITSGLAGTLIGGGLGAAAGQLANLSRTTAPLAPALSMLGGAAGAAIGKKLPAFSLKSSRPYVKEDIGRALVGYGNLIQMKRMNIPPTIIKAYRKSLADLIDPDVVSAVQEAVSKSGLKEGVAEVHSDVMSLLKGLKIPQEGRRPGMFVSTGTPGKEKMVGLKNLEKLPSLTKEEADEMSKGTWATLDVPDPVPPHGFKAKTKRSKK